MRAGSSAFFLTTVRVGLTKLACCGWQASVETSCTSPSMVVSVLGPDGKILCKVDQRRLYRKNGWPAKADIVKALQEMPLDN